MKDNPYVTQKDITTAPFWNSSGIRLGQLDIELTERCNNACQHCYINLPELDSNAEQRELSTQEWKDILQQAADLGAMSVRFSGGEPLLRNDFRDLYLFTRRLGMKVLLFTNGRLITKELIDLFKRIPPGQKIEITVYGMRPETYDAVACSPGAFESFWRGANLLLENQVPFIVKGALLPENEADVQALKNWAHTIPWMDREPTFTVLFDLRGRHDSPARNRLIQNLRHSPESYIEWIKQQVNISADSYFHEMHQFCSKFIGPGGANLFNCGAGISGNVDAYGKYQPCMLLRDPQLSYDLRKGTLRDALEHFFPQIREITSNNPEYLNRCAQCFLKGLCEQCPAKSWAEHGDLDTPVEYLCQVAHAQARYLGLIFDGENAWEVDDWQQRIKNISLKNKENNLWM
jgi:radical SAM protein with 4Fe4S-binding SPASM domain